MKKTNSIAPNSSLGFIFLMSGIVMSITLGFAIGMSFLVTGFVFLIVGQTQAGEPGPKDAE